MKEMKRMLKKLLFGALISVSLLSCTKVANKTNPLANTLWVMEDSLWEYTRYIEFGETNIVSVWDSQGRQKFYGTYIFNGNKVSFSNLYDKRLEREYIDGSFSSNSITINCYNTLKEEKQSYTYIKQ